MITTILLHEIQWDYRNAEFEELPDSEEEEIKRQITGGFNCGELCYFDEDTQTEANGWWQIVEPKN